MATRKPNRIPILLFPLHGSGDVQDMTHEEFEAAVRAARLNVRKHWKHPGVQSLITFLELTTTRLTADAITAGATVHDQGRASGASEQLTMIRAIVTGQEA
jgi:hypothetical protein